MRATVLLSWLLVAPSTPAGATVLPGAGQEASGQEPGQESGEPPAEPPTELEPDAQGDDLPQAQMPTQIVRDIRVEGLRFYDESVVLNALEQKIGEPFDFERVRRSMNALYETYKILVTVSAVTVEDGMILVLEASESPADFEPRFLGNQEVDRKELLEWAGLDRAPVVYLSETERIRLRLIEAYRRHGFHFVEVDVVTRGGTAVEDPPDVIFEIREGPEVRCVGVEVRGNEGIPDTGWGVWRGGLRQLAEFQTKGRGLLRWWGKIFDEEVLQADLVALKNVYRARGWLDVEVYLEQLAFSPERDKVRVSITVDEGPLYRVQGLRIEAFEAGPEGLEDLQPVPLAFDEQELLALCSLVKGSPYEEGILLRDRLRLRKHYGERGYIDAEYFVRGPRGFPDGWVWLDPVRVVDYARKEVLITYRMLQGRPRRVRDVRFRGNAHTRDKVLRREVSVLPGEWANLTEMERSRGRLRGTGFFSDEMNPLHEEVRMQLHETEDPDYLDVEYVVNEGRVVNFQLTGGVSSDIGLIGQLSLSIRNFDISSPPESPTSLFGDFVRKEAFHGNGEYMFLSFAPGTERSTQGIRYRHPDLFGSHFDRWTADLSMMRSRHLFSSHRQGSTRVEVEIGRDFGFEHSVDFGPVYAVSRVSELDSDDVLPDTLLSSVGRRRYQGLGLGYRYQDLDNRWVPSDGVELRSKNTYFGGLFGGDEDFTKSELTLDWYVPFGANPEDARPGFYMGMGGGVAYPRGGSDSILYGERFFLGGASNLRGFEYRGVGPFVDENGKLTDIAIGGETYLRGSFELRFPLFTVPLPGTTYRREVFRWTFFVDWGVLDPEAFELAVNQTRVSAGFGFGLAQPIPLTFNFGWPLRDGVGDDPEVFSFRLTIR